MAGIGSRIGLQTGEEPAKTGKAGDIRKADRGGICRHIQAGRLDMPMWMRRSQAHQTPAME